MRAHVTSRITLLIVMTLALTACHGVFENSDDNGGGSHTDVKTFQKADAVIGQADFQSRDKNRGLSQPRANTLKSPSGQPASRRVAGLFYLPDQGNNRVLVYNRAPTNTSGTAATGVLGQNGFHTSQSGTTRNTFDQPADALIVNNRLVVTDRGNNRILIWSLLPQNNSSAPEVVLGQKDFSTSTSGTSQEKLDQPASVTTANGKLIVADKNNNRVLIFNSIPTTHNSSQYDAKADVVIGQNDFTSHVGDTTKFNLKQPTAVWSNGSRLVIADTGNNRVLIYNSIPTSNGAAADVVVGQSNFTSGGSSTSRDTLSQPEDVYASNNQLIVADTGNNRVLVFDSFPTSNQPDADEVLGQDDFTHHTANDDDQDGNSDSQPTRRTLNAPTAVFTLNGRLYVTDNGNNRVLLFNGF